MDKMLSEEQIEHWGKQWKEALGMSPYRMYADKDFQAGATHAQDVILETVNFHCLEEEDLGEKILKCKKQCSICKENNETKD